MQKLKETQKTILVHFALLMAVSISLLTIFLFPTSEPGTVIIKSSWREIAHPNIVTLSPAFGHSPKLYSFILSPNLKKYAKCVSSSEGVILLSAESPWIEANGTVIFKNRSFAWIYWLLIVAVPSVLLSCVTLWIAHHNILENHISQKSSNF